MKGMGLSARATGASNSFRRGPAAGVHSRQARCYLVRRRLAAAGHTDRSDSAAAAGGPLAGVPLDVSSAAANPAGPLGSSRAPVDGASAADASAQEPCHPQQHHHHHRKHQQHRAPATPPNSPATVPARNGWVQGLLSMAESVTGSSTAAAAAAAAANSSSSDATSRSSSPNSMLPLLLDLPKQLQQLTGRLALTPPPAAAPAAAAAAAAAAVAAATRPPSPGQLRQLPRSLAAALRRLPSQGAAATSSGSGDVLAATASLDVARSNAGADAAAVGQLLLSLRAAASEEAWLAFADSVALAAGDALLLSAVPAAVATATHASLDGSWDGSWDEADGKPGAMMMASADAARSQKATSSAASSDAAAEAPAAAALALESGMLMSGRHFTTTIPSLSASRAASNETQRQLLAAQAAAAAAEAEAEAATDSEAAAAAGMVAAAAAAEDSARVLQATEHEPQKPAQHQVKHHPPPPQAKQLRGRVVQAAPDPEQPLVLASMREDAPGTTAYNWSTLHQQEQQEQPEQSQPEKQGAASSTTTSSGGAWSAAGCSKYEHLVFGGGGARCFGYAGALHALRQLGLLGRLKGVSGSSGGAVYALLAALQFSVAEVQAAMGTLPETESLSWLRLNSRLGLSDGEATFRQIEAAIAAKLGVPSPSLSDVASASGCHITLAATSLARRAPVYLTSSSHPDMPVRDALRASCAIPFFFSPMRGPNGDLLVDGCISDCTPLAGLAAGGNDWDPSRTLVLAVHDAAGLEAPDFQGLLSGLIATLMQAGYHHTAAAGIDLLNLWPAVAGVNPLQFRLPPDQARDVIAASQALAEEFAVNKMRQLSSAAAAAAEAAGQAAGLLPGYFAGDGSSVHLPPSLGQLQGSLLGSSSTASGVFEGRASGSKRATGHHATSLLAGMGSGSSGSSTAAEVLGHSHTALEAAGLHHSYSHASVLHALWDSSTSSSGDGSNKGSSGGGGGEAAAAAGGGVVTLEGGHQATSGMRQARHGSGSGSSGGQQRGLSSLSSTDGAGSGDISLSVSEEDWAAEDVESFKGVEEEGQDDSEDFSSSSKRTGQGLRLDVGLPQQWLSGSGGSDGSGMRMAGTAAAAAAAAAGLMGGNGSGLLGEAWLRRLAVERLLRAGVSLPPSAAAAPQQDGGRPSVQHEAAAASGGGSGGGGAITDAEWRLIQRVLEQQELLLQQQEAAAAASASRWHQQQQEAGGSSTAKHGAAATATAAGVAAGGSADGEESCGLGPVELVVVERADGISQVCLAAGSPLASVASLASLDAAVGDDGAGGADHQLLAAHAGSGGLAPVDAAGRDCLLPLQLASLATFDESLLHG